MTTVFTRIIKGEIPGTFVYRDEVAVAFLSINPMAIGHVLVVPVAEVDEWTDLSPAVMSHVMTLSHGIGRAQKRAFDCQRIGLIVAGYEVPHCHVHVIPTVDMGQLSFANAAATVERGDLEAAATRLRQAMTEIGLHPAER